MEVTGGGSILATAGAWGERDTSKQRSSEASRYALAMTLVRHRNLAGLFHPVLKAPHNIQPTECLLLATSLSQNTALVLLHLIVLNNPVIHEVMQSQHLCLPAESILLCLNISLEIFPFRG